MTNRRAEIYRLHDLVRRPVTLILLSMYVLFYRTTLWRGEMRSWAASGLVGIVLIILALSALCMFEIAIGYRLTMNKYVGALLISLPAMLFMDWKLNARDAASRFEQRFDHLPKRERVIFRLIAVAVPICVVLMFFFLVAPLYQGVFHIAPKK